MATNLSITVALDREASDPAPDFRFEIDENGDGVITRLPGTLVDETRRLGRGTSNMTWVGNAVVHKLTGTPFALRWNHAPPAARIDLTIAKPNGNVVQHVRRILGFARGAFVGKLP